MLKESRGGGPWKCEGHSVRGFSVWKPGGNKRGNWVQRSGLGTVGVAAAGWPEGLGTDATEG